jgi:hypothetical protein
MGREDKAGSEDGLVIVAAQMVLMNSREAVRVNVEKEVSRGG